MSLIEYTGTITETYEMVYPSNGGLYFLSGMPNSVSSVVAYAIRTLLPSSGNAPYIENEYQLTTTTATDTFIDVTVTGTISDGTLRIKHREEALGTWSSEYLPSETTLISGIPFHFDTSLTYTNGDEFEFKVYPLEVIDYTPIDHNQLYVDMSNGRLYTPGETDFDRIAVSYHSLGTILRVTNTIVPQFVYRINEETSPLHRGDIVYASSDTGIKKCDSSIHYVFYGAVIETIYPNTSGRIQIAGSCPHFLGLSVGKFYYVDDGGRITNTNTATPAFCVGFAENSTTLYISRWTYGT